MNVRRVVTGRARVARLAFISALLLAVCAAGGAIAPPASATATATPAVESRGFTSGQLRTWWSFDGTLHIRDRLTSCAKAPDGSIYAVGSTNDNKPTSGDIVLVKFDASGWFQWLRVYHVPGSVFAGAAAVTTDADSSVVVTGGRNDGAQYDIFTAKFNGLGVLQWYAVKAGIAGANDNASDLVTDASGNVYVAGEMDGGDEAVVVKYDADADPANPGKGKEEWTHHILGTAAYESAEAREIARDSSGNIYVVGTRATAGGGDDIYVAKIKADGGRTWLRGYNSYRKRGDYGEQIACSSRGVWVGGNIDKPKGSADTVLLHYSATGHRDWVHTWDDSLHKAENIADLGVDRFGNAYLAADFWPSATAHKGVLIKYSHAGARRWIRTYRGVSGAGATGGTNFADLAVSSSGTTWLVGDVHDGTSSGWLVIKYTAAGKRAWATRWPLSGSVEPTNGQAWSCVTSGTSDLFVAGDLERPAGGWNSGAGWFVR